jgi:hypothetical protein
MAIKIYGQDVKNSNNNNNNKREPEQNECARNRASRHKFVISCCSYFFANLLSDYGYIKTATKAGNPTISILN